MSVRSVETTGDGQYVVTALPPGPYRLELSRAGFKAHVEEFVLFVSQDLRVDASLQVGAPSEQVVVLASSIALERDSTAVGTIVENAQVVNLPLDGRNFLELALLVPGTAPAAQGSASSVRGDFAFTAAGGREDANGFLLDGVDNVDPKLNTPAVRPPVDAIREFEVVTSSYEPEIGRYGAGQVNVVLKSGTNNLHGTGYGFFRNGAMDATNFFAPREEPAPDYNRNQFGGSIGGPIRRDRLFFFADYEGTRVTEGITQVTNVPTAAERAGDFSQSVLPKPINFLSGQPFPGDQDAVVLPEPDRAGDRRRCTRCPTATRRSPTTSRRPTSRIATSSSTCASIGRSAGGLDLSARYSFSDRTLLEPFAGSGFSLRARLRQHPRSSCAEPGGVGRQRDHASPAERGALRLHARGQSGEPGRAGHQHQPAGRVAGVVGEPARLGPELHHRHRLLAARAGIQQPAEGHHRRVPVRGHAHLESWCASDQGRVRPADRATGRLPRRPGPRPAGVHPVCVHRQRAGGPAAGPADDHGRRGARQPAAPAHREPRLLRSGSVARDQHADAHRRPAVRVDFGPGGRRRTARRSTTRPRGASSPSAPAACRAPGTNPTATTSRRAWGLPGRRRRKPSCAAPTASTTTSRRWRPRRGCTSATRTSTSISSSPRRGCRRSRSTTHSRRTTRFRRPSRASRSSAT